MYNQSFVPRIESKDEQHREDRDEVDASENN